jgi:hypothetical protein
MKGVDFIHKLNKFSPFFTARLIRGRRGIRDSGIALIFHILANFGIFWHILEKSHTQIHTQKFVYDLPKITSDLIFVKDKARSLRILILLHSNKLAKTKHA